MKHSPKALKYIFELTEEGISEVEGRSIEVANYTEKTKNNDEKWAEP